MFSCLVLERLAPLDMMDEPRVQRDKSWTDGSDTHSQSQHSSSSLQTKARGTSSGEEMNSTTTVYIPELVETEPSKCFKCQVSNLYIFLKAFLFMYGKIT